MKRFTGTVPDDMVANILLRLDAKTLVALKSVSKSTVAQEKQQEIHIVHDKIPGTRNPVSLVNLGTRQLITTLKFPANKCLFTLVGSACGIVCFYDLSDVGINEYYLWNPATKSFKTVPSLPITDDSEAHFIADYGFCFDEIDNNFKIIRVMWRLCYTEEFEYSPRSYDKVYVEVYSSKRNVCLKFEQEVVDFCVVLDVMVSSLLIHTEDKVSVGKKSSCSV
ncbi:uncharacterized protein LOC141703080 [Apium graveolens]|uniref:uncharacterized protein LOC141703080 n=1 Tax=Apium graveolens TaxID=4045 RepID=UPI003D7BBA06